MTIPRATPRLDEPRSTARTRVVSIPAGHPYIRSVTADPRVAVLDDPPVPGAADGVWWPPQALDPDWIRAHADSADLLHVHFGTESFPPGHLTDCVDAAHAAGWPVVFTVHDLTHPQLSDQGAYRDQLDELVPKADALVTLTDSAAAEIRERWGRDAVVLPHPSIVGDISVSGIGALGEELRIGVHLKDLRAGTDGPGTVRTLLEAVTLLRERGTAAVAEIRMHRTVRDTDARQAVRHALGDHPHALLIEQERLPDDVLFAALSGLDACVLPYRAGSHSGWLELCWDLGVPVIAPAIGHFGDQHPRDGVAEYPPGDASALAAALAELLASQFAARPGSLARAQLVDSRRARRRETDAATAAAHAELYSSLRLGLAA